MRFESIITKLKRNVQLDTNELKLLNSVFTSIITKLQRNVQLDTNELNLLKFYTNCSQFNKNQTDFVNNIVTKLNDKQDLNATEVVFLVQFINILQTRNGCSGFRSTSGSSRKYKFHPIYGKLRY